MADLHDFGEKIGGARKDVWQSRGLDLRDIAEMNDLERKNNIKKDNIWPRPDWEKAISEGTPQAVAYWQNKMRQSVPPKPPKDDQASQDNYVKVVGKIRDAVMSVDNSFDIDNFYMDFIRPEFVEAASRGYYVTIIPEASGIVTNKVLKAAQSKFRKMEEEAKQKLFGIPKDEQTYVATKNRLTIHHYDGDNVKVERNNGYCSDGETSLIIGNTFGRSFYYLRENDPFHNIDSWEKGTWFVMDNNCRKPVQINIATKEEALEFVESFAKAAQKLENAKGTEGRKKKSDSNRKTAFVPPQLKHIHRDGPNYRRFGQHADSDLFLDDLKFRGGEFGNWLNSNDRQASLDMAYDALRDLACVLEIKPEDVAFDKSLSIAFGARGRGGANAASAHYEPDRQVINLTKMSGAGCLAHEWGHALDHAIGRACGIVGLASEAKNRRALPESFQTLLSSLRYKKIMSAPGEIDPEIQSKIDHAKKNLKNWIASVKPFKLPDNMEKAWGETTQAILDNASTFTGSEYYSFRRGDPIQTHPQVEILSQISKAATNHCIPRNAKQQIVLWAAEVKRVERFVSSKEPVERTIKTDFYKGSIEFDQIHSRAGHGYWQSECEMFARAFDCYISDKIKDSGLRSEYLSAYADSFTTNGKDGTSVSAFPKGEERQLINDNFDQLLHDLKERGILHEHTEILEQEEHKPERPEAEAAPLFDLPSTNIQYEQMSLDDLLFSAQERRQEHNHQNTKSQDLQR